MNRTLVKSDNALELKDKIDSWKRNKTTVKMPEALWQELVVAAKTDGARAVSRFYNIGYAGLVKRMPSLKQIKTRVINSGFIELPQMPVTNGLSCIEVSLTNSIGQSVTIRGSGSSADWENLFSGWLRASRPEQVRVR